eukprot:ctg_1163.g415
MFSGRYGRQPSLPPAYSNSGALQPARSASSTAGRENEAVQMLRLTREEQTVYSEIYRQARDAATGFVAGDQAAAVLRRSNLYRDILRDIWNIADHTKRGYLDQDQFFVALRLVAICQRGGEASLESMRRFRGMQLLPKLEAPPPPSASSATRSAAASILSTPSPLPTGASSARGKPQPPPAPVNWVPTYEQIAKYDTMMRQFCSSGSNAGRHDSGAPAARAGPQLVLSGEVARNALPKIAQQRLSQTVLREVWELSDQDRDGALDVQEFRCAAHLLQVLSEDPERRAVPRPLPAALEKRNLRLRFGEGTSSTSADGGAATASAAQAYRAERPAAHATNAADASGENSRENVDTAVARLKALRNHLDILDVRGRALAEKKRATMAGGGGSLERIYTEERAFLRDAIGVIEACMQDLGGSTDATAAGSGGEARAGREPPNAVAPWDDEDPRRLQQLLVAAKTEAARERAKAKMVEEELYVAKRQINDMVAATAAATNAARNATGAEAWMPDGSTERRDQWSEDAEGEHEPGRGKRGTARSRSGRSAVSGSLVDSWPGDEVKAGARPSQRRSTGAYDFSAMASSAAASTSSRNKPGTGRARVPDEWSQAGERTFSGGEADADTRRAGPSPDRRASRTTDTATVFGAYARGPTLSTRRVADKRDTDGTGARPSERRRARRAADERHTAHISAASDEDTWRDADLQEEEEEQPEVGGGRTPRSSKAPAARSRAEDEWARSASTAAFDFW